MAKIKLNPIVEEMHGGVGNLVFRKLAGQTVVSGKPSPTTAEPTENQAAQRERFREAAVYGRVALADAQTKTFYEGVADRKGIPVFALMVADFLNAPSVDEIDLSAFTGAANDPIYIRTHDDVQVDGVNVRMENVGGTEIERGPASMDSSTGRWVYQTRTAIDPGSNIRITVTATDRPGGVGTSTAEKSM